MKIQGVPRVVMGFHVRSGFFVSHALPKPFSEPVTVFHERRLPEAARPAGYAALIEAYDLPVPLPLTLSAIGERHRIVERDGWRILTPRHAPQATLEGHLTFALKHEGLDLAVLKRLFLAVRKEEIEELVRATPTGIYARRIWFLYEWLLGSMLDLPALDRGTYTEIVDPKQQWASAPVNVTRQRVRNNLPGTPDFCPLIFRTEALERCIEMDLAARAREVASRVPADVLARTAAFLLLKDSKASYVIEGENPPQDRIQRWGRAIGEAGGRPFDRDELLRLQRIVIGDQRFVLIGFRREGGFVGEHDRETGAPLPDHISARPQDLAALMAGMEAFDRDAAQHLDPVLSAAVLAFGFVYAHPFEDGNGRLHRYLIHHVLAQRGFNPPGVVFPVSAAILNAIAAYRRVLESYSQRLLPVIEWRTTERNSVEVLNDTGDFYRFFDATPQAEFLFECVRRTVEEDLPFEADYLCRHDLAVQRIMNAVEMPDRTAASFVMFVRQSGGTLSRRRREREFEPLTDEEVQRLEDIVNDAFEGLPAGLAET
jgi:hypothetical protein